MSARRDRSVLNARRTEYECWRGFGSEARACDTCFFFQAEDGIRDLTVTGVQTCALPISFAESTNTSALASLIAPTMASAYRVPGFTSRGASQHLSPWCSRFSTMDLATAAS